MIHIRQLHKRLGRRDVLKGLSLEISRGERIALIGSNGAGKTTLIRCLLGEYRFSGTIALDGRSPLEARTEVLRLVGFVPQLPPPLRMPVGQLVRYVAAVSKSDAETIVRVAADLGFDVERFRHQPFFRLSGGQKQKLLIAAALGRDVALLVMDEPAANLDPEARGVFFEQLAARQRDTVMLISSHRLDEVAALVNRVIELDQGLIVLDDRVADNTAMAERLNCFIRLSREDSAFSAAISSWGFRPVSGKEWRGQVVGPDRLRFLGTVSRYAGLISGFEMQVCSRD